MAGTAINDVMYAVVTLAPSGSQLSHAVDLSQRSSRSCAPRRNKGDLRQLGFEYGYRADWFTHTLTIR